MNCYKIFMAVLREWYVCSGVLSAYVATVLWAPVDVLLP